MIALRPDPLPLRMVMLLAVGAGVVALAAALSIRPAGLAVETPMADHMHMQAEAAGAASGSAARPTTTVRPLSCERLPNVPGKSITTALVKFPPGGYTPAHRHPGSVTAFVVKGTIRSQLSGGPVDTFGPGTTWFEPPGALHMFAENASATDSAELLAVFVADDDCGPLTIPEPQ
ncbi:quercetin dioxygenase-like cupin family protein [Inquilinus ginsengisoli]|jgi:quercetin dioxygenase-like cupin family protein|uniref:Quercetin dioxygenase-like cupin family protein n=1 Tax=Inquilinus ginsengisoli TaxID=363840 RepID=A0ABU1JWY9_9PROT|nr:cupin domain-containing protein [Inquilinus ginsengisoli]MDR6292065.1 quercetin dioxygenase-like cupin family protein [Inquilinus ginsengisoli]